MFSRFVEGSPTVYLLLAFGLLVNLGLWWRTRKRSFLIAAGVFALLIGGYYLLDRSVDTDDKKLVRAVNDIAADLTAGKVDAAMKLVSDAFDGYGSNKKGLEDYCKLHISRGEVSSFKVWDVTVEQVSRAERTATVRFNFKVQGSWGESLPTWFLRVNFVLDPDDQWRVKSFAIYDSFNNSNTPVAIPGWGRR
jgi:hypothetical protein